MFKYDFSQWPKTLYNTDVYPRANGAKRRSGRKPGAWVTNRAIAKSKVGSSRKGGHYVIFSEVVVERKKNITKTRQTIQNSEKKDEYELDKHEVSKSPFFLSFRHSKCIVLSDISSDLFRLHSCRE